MIRHLLGAVVDRSVETRFPDIGSAIASGRDLVAGARDLREKPGAPIAQARALTAIANAWSALALAGRADIVTGVLAAGSDRFELLATLVHSRDMQNRALGMVRVPLGTSGAMAPSLTERIDETSGAFRMDGDRFAAQGGWRLEYGDSVRSVAYARWDFHDQFLASGAIISTIGERTPDLPLAESPPEKPTPPVPDAILNFLGRGSAWIGRNRSGGKVSFEQDEYGQYPLGDTTEAPKGAIDAYARLHDIEYFVSTHFEKGTEVRVRSPDGGYEYFRSDGDPGAANARVIARVWWALTPIGILQGLATPEILGRRDPETSAPVDLGDRTGLQVVDRRARLAQASGGAYEEVVVDRRRDGVTTTLRRSRASYSIRYDGTAVSKAVAEYERTGAWALYDRKRAPPNARAGGSGSERGERGHGAGELGTGHIGARAAGSAAAAGGVLLTPNVEISGDGSGWLDALANRATAAVGDGRSGGGLRIDGREYVVLRGRRPQPKSASAVPVAASAGSSRGTSTVGRFTFVQTDVALTDASGATLELQRFHDSSSDGAGGAGWSWLPFELRKSDADELTLVDRPASHRARYSSFSDSTGSLAPVEDGEAPRLWRSAARGHAAEFAHGFTVAFDAAGRPTRIDDGSPQGAITLEYRDGRLSRMSRGALTVAMRFDRDGRRSSAICSDGREVIYRYDDRGRLARVTVGPSELRIGYDANGRVVEIAPEPGDAIVRNAYDALGRMVWHEAGSRRWNLSYDAMAGNGLRVVVRSGAESTRYYFDARDRLVGYGPEGGSITLLNRADDGRLVQIARGSFLGESAGALRLRVEDIVIPIDQAAAAPTVKE